MLLATICAATCAGNVDAQSPASQVKISNGSAHSEAQLPLNSTLEIRVARRPWMTERTAPPKPPTPPPSGQPYTAPNQYPPPAYAKPYSGQSFSSPPSLSNIGQPRSNTGQSRANIAQPRSSDGWDRRGYQSPSSAPYADLQQPSVPAPPPQLSYPAPPSANAPMRPMVIIERDPREMSIDSRQPRLQPVQPRMEPYQVQTEQRQIPVEPHHQPPPSFDGGQMPMRAADSPSDLKAIASPAQEGRYAEDRYGEDPYILPELDKGRPWPPGPDPEPHPSDSPRSIRQFLEDTTARTNAARHPEADRSAAAEPAETAPLQREPIELEPVEDAHEVAEAIPEEAVVESAPAESPDRSMSASQQARRPAEPLARAEAPQVFAAPPVAEEAVEATRPLVPLDYAGFPRAKIRLNSTVAGMKNPIRQCLSHYYSQYELVEGRSNWGMLHAIMVYGIDTKVQAGDKTYSTIGWIAGNNICRGQRLVEQRDGELSIKTGVGLQGHQGQMLAIFSLCDVPESYPIYAGDVKYTLRDVVDHEMAACKNDVELTFTLIGLSHYLDTESIWMSEDGEAWTFERLLRAELSKPIVGAACGGTHRLMGFAHALRERRGEGRPITGQWRRAEQFTDDFIEYAFQLQNSDGSMSTHWFEGREDNGSMDRKIQTTGHIVEWLLTVLPDTELQDPRLVSAVRFLLASMSNNRDHEWSIGPKGHALRSLAMFYERVYKSGPAWRNPRMARGEVGSGR